MIKNLNSTANKMNNAQLWMIGMMTKGAIKVANCILPSQINPKYIPENKYYLSMFYTDFCISLVKDMETKNNEPLTCSRVKVHTG